MVTATTDIADLCQNLCQSVEKFPHFSSLAPIFYSRLWIHTTNLKVVFERQMFSYAAVAISQLDNPKFNPFHGFLPFPCYCYNSFLVTSKLSPSNI